jgi:hypothetical protein
MTPLFKKLNFKDQPVICIVNAPDSFSTEIEAISKCAKVQHQLNEKVKSSFILGFCTKQKEVDALAQKANISLEGDGLFWIAYPKGSSKKYECDFNRDTGWAKLGSLGFEPVRQVAIDEDWSGLRFRRVQYIKKMNRSFAMTEEGKKKAGKF